MKSYIRSTNGLTISRRPTNSASFVQNSIRGPTHNWVINSNRHYLLVIYNSNQSSSLVAWAESSNQTRISRYIGLYSAESTITHAKSSLRLFLGSALGRKLIAETLEAAGEQYFAERRDYQTDVETFFKSIRHYAPKSINMILSFTKGFLGRNSVKFDEYYWRDLKGKHKGLKGNRPLTEDQAPTPEILRKILQFLPLHGRAFALAASSSGMRLGESLRLKLSDIELDKEPVRIHI